MGSNYTCKPWVFFLKSHIQIGTTTTYMHINQPPVCADKSGKSLKMDPANSIPQFPTNMSHSQLARVKGGFIPETPVRGSLRKNALHTLGLSVCHTALQVIFKVLCALSSHGQKGYRMPPWYFPATGPCT